MTKHSLQEFIASTSQVDRGEGKFELESPHLLEVHLDGMVWTKWGSMVAYRGDIKFDKAGISDKGIGKFFKEAMTGEGMTLTKAKGSGILYLADQGKRISIINLQEESIFVNGNDVLAFEDNINWDIKMMRKAAGMMAGGLFNVKLSGTGMVAITTHKEPITLMVKPDNPVLTDPNATVAWSGTLSPELKTDISFKTFTGRGSGESLQMRFFGDGFVVIQPYEEIVAIQAR
ncbi:MAG: AIM24 family protein [Thermoplasmatota archaeon]